MADKRHINTWAQVYFQQHFVTSHKSVPIIPAYPELRSRIMRVFKILHHFTAPVTERIKECPLFYACPFISQTSDWWLFLHHQLWSNGPKLFFFHAFFPSCQLLPHLFVCAISAECTWRKITMKYVFYPFIVQRVTRLKSWANLVIFHFYSSNPFVFVLVSGRSMLKRI